MIRLFARCWPITTTNMETKKIYPTVITPLETSERKSERVRSVIDDYQSVLSVTSDYMPSVEKQHWRPYDTTVNRLAYNQSHDHGLRVHEVQLAAYEVAQAFKRHPMQHGSSRPNFEGGGNYMRMCSCGLKLLDNDEGYGLKVNLRPYKPEYFKIKASEYHAKEFENALNNDIEIGVSQLHLSDEGDIEAHLTFGREVEVYEPEEVDRSIGVDIGERVLYAATVIDNGEVEGVDIKRGREFRHNRERLKQKRKKMRERSDFNGAKKCRGEHYRYTDHVTHSTSRELVNFAKGYQPAAIVLEDLTNYRKNAKDAIHDWPYADLQRKIVEKATAERIPVKFINPVGTSYTCSSCGHDDTNSRDGADFECSDCGYTVHADVNAAKNIAVL